MNVTRIWGVQPDGKRWLMNEITPVSRFTNDPWPKGEPNTRHTHETQRKAAENIIEGWKMHGSHPSGTRYEIEHGDKVLQNGPTLDETCRKAGIDMTGFTGFAA